jgi:hypothetical protein
MADQPGATRDSIDSTARALREATGGRLTQEQARERVERAVRTGDNKRSNGGR